MDGESGPTLDLKLPCWESGRIDNLRIQEPFEDKESRESSTIGVAGANSPCLVDGCLANEDLVCIIWVCEECRGFRDRFVVLNNEDCWLESCIKSLLEVAGIAELVVPGRDENTLRKSLSVIIDLLLLVFGR